MARITPYAQKNTYKVYFKNPNGIDGTSTALENSMAHVGPEKRNNTRFWES